MKVKYVLTILLFLPVALFAQDGELPSIDLSQYATTFTVFVATVLFIIQAIKERLKVKKGFLVAISWSTGLILSVIAHYANIGFFADLDLITSIIWGAGASAVSNTGASVDTVQTIISFAVRLIPKKKK